MSRSVQTTAPVMSDAELHKSLERVDRIQGMVQGDVLERTITTSGPDTHVETRWPRDDKKKSPR